MKRLRVVLDTNLFISFLINNDIEPLKGLITDREITLVYSDALLQEIIDVSQRNKFRKFFSEKTVFELIAIVARFGEEVGVTSTVDVCRDAKDNFLLALCRDGKANCLITGDKDLLVLSQFESTKITTFRQFIDALPHTP